MCLRPILIKNPNYRIDKNPHFKNVDYTRTSNYQLKDTTSQFIRVPCGRCPQCLQAKQNSLIQRSQIESVNHYMFMATFTYSDDMLRYIDVNGFRHAYADFTDVQKMFKRIRKSNGIGREFKYMIVSEYGGKKHRPHFHMQLFVRKLPTDTPYTPLNLERKLYDLFKSEWKRNVGISDKYPIWKPLCKFISTRRGRTYDFHYVVENRTEKGSQDVSFYVTKYCLKFDNYVKKKQQALRLNLEPDKYYEVWKLLKPKFAISKGFGLSNNDTFVNEYISKCIQVSIDSPKFKFPIYINRVTGQTFPLGSYYRKKFYTLDNAYSFFYKSDQEDNINYFNEDLDHSTKSDQKYDKICQQISLKNESFDEFDLII